MLLHIDREHFRFWLMVGRAIVGAVDSDAVHVFDDGCDFVEHIGHELLAVFVDFLDFAVPLYHFLQFELIGLQ